MANSLSGQDEPNPASMSNTTKLSWFVWGTVPFDSICMASIRTTRSQDPWNSYDTWTFLVLKAWQQTSVDSYEALYNSIRFARSWSAPLEVKIREIMPHEPSSFLKRGNKLKLIHMRQFTAQLNSHWVASRVNQLPALWINNRGNDSCQFNWIESNWQHFKPTLHCPGAQYFYTNQLPEWQIAAGETIHVDSIESTWIDNNFNPPCIV